MNQGRKLLINTKFKEIFNNNTFQRMKVNKYLTEVVQIVQHHLESLLETG